MSYFKNIDTPNKAYFVGLLYADGCIYKRMKGNYEEINLILSLQEKDIELLYAFADEFNLPYSRVRIRHSGRENEQRTATVHITRKDITQDIQDLKTEDLLNRIPKELIWHFVRGFFDGDGCIYVRRNSKRILYFGVGFCGYSPVLDLIRNLCPELQKVQDKRSNGLFNLTSNRQATLRFLFENMYRDSDIHLKRKHDKFLEFISYSSSTILKRSRAK